MSNEYLDEEEMASLQHVEALAAESDLRFKIRSCNLTDRFGRKIVFDIVGVRKPANSEFNESCQYVIDVAIAVQR